MWRTVDTLDNRLKGFHGLDRSLEADRAWRQAMECRGLGHDGPNEIVSKDMRPDLFPHQFWRFAAQFIHLQSAFDRAQIEFVVPTRAIEVCQVLRSGLQLIEERRHDHDGLRAK